MCLLLLVLVGVLVGVVSAHYEYHVVHELEEKINHDEAMDKVKQLRMQISAATAGRAAASPTHTTCTTSRTAAASVRSQERGTMVGADGCPLWLLSLPVLVCAGALADVEMGDNEYKEDVERY